MLSFVNSLPIEAQIYIYIGIAVFLLVWKSFAYRGANRVRGSMSGHPVSSYRDQGIQPTWFDFLLCLGWCVPMMLGWPVVLFFYLTGNNHNQD